MNTEPDLTKPGSLINWLFRQRKSRSDDEILMELKALPVLPDEDVLIKSNDIQDWRNIYLFLVLANQAAARHLRPAISLLLERASYGDPGETMRDLRHSLEAIVKPDWDVLAKACMEATTFPQRGARLWPVRELGVLRDERARTSLVKALDDSADEVRLAAQSSLKMLDKAQR
jgi:hypothetical protein